QIFYLFGGYLLAAPIDLIFFTPVNDDVAVLINGDQIAGAVKTAGVIKVIAGWRRAAFCDAGRPYSG
ncbi:hypothetical protein KU710_22770, partial [Salmonella enterica subsp. enterica serovar Give]|nr:hypothetical protein [Salmonella enterica subsp. enterica serovar Give]